MKHTPKISLRHKLVFWAVLITVLSTFVAEGIVWGLLFPTALESRATTHIVWVGLIAALLGGVLGLWISSSLNRRLQRMIDIGRAWLRGNLLVRIADPVADDLGLLGEQLDLLAEHLEHDEQDLSELRARDIRQTDQIRTLAVTEERNRLARELHDSIKQYLFSLAMTAGGLRTRFDCLLADPQAASQALPQFAETVHELEATAQTAQREITRLIRDLKPDTLEEQGLGAALNDYALLFGAREHILAYVDVQGNDAILPPSVAEALYRVAQEALHNVARHARATRVDLRLRCLPEQVTLTVSDNGVGFDPQQSPRRGLGIANMEERMMAVGGQVTVEGRPGRGTTVTARVALTSTPGGARPEPTVSEQERPRPGIENWSWLGQRLVIPVGQTWPWLPADQVHLRQPIIETNGEALAVRERRGLGGKQFELFYATQRIPLLRIRRAHAGYRWRLDGATWTLRYVARSRDQMVLTRNEQPLAALQAQGRLAKAWSELIYDDRGYRMACGKGHCTLTDQEGNEVLLVTMGTMPEIELKRPIPLPLLAMVTARAIDDVLWMSNISGRTAG